MQYAFTTHGFAPSPDLAEFARTTALFEIWRPRHTWSRLAIRVARAPGASERYRCQVSAEDDRTRRVAEAIADNAFDAVRAAAVALADRGHDPAIGSSAVAAVPPAVLSSLRRAIGMQPSEAP